MMSAGCSPYNWQSSMWKARSAVPIGGVKGERPEDALQRQALATTDSIHVCVVIIVNELVSQGPPENGEGDRASTRQRPGTRRRRTSTTDVLLLARSFFPQRDSFLLWKQGKFRFPARLPGSRR